MIERGKLVAAYADRKTQISSLHSPSRLSLYRFIRPPLQNLYFADGTHVSRFKALLAFPQQFNGSKGKGYPLKHVHTAFERNNTRIWHCWLRSIMLLYHELWATCLAWLDEYEEPSTLATRHFFGGRRPCFFIWTD